MRVYLDDERETPPGFTRTYTADETIELLRPGCVTELSLDHDLGDEAAGTGYDVLLWIEKAVAEECFSPPAKITIHSANAGARPKMLAAVEAIRRLAGYA
jgi:hypothetical protein